MKKHFKALLTVTVIFLLLFAVTVITAVAVEQNANPTVSIDYCNLSFNDSIYIKYAVRAENISDTEKVELLVWSEESYLKCEEATSILSSVDTEKINGVDYLIFNYCGLSAKQMTDVVYARARVNTEDGDVYSTTNKYSILQYAYNKLGKTGTETENQQLKKLLSNMLVYGASAQEYFEYKTDRLATAEFYQIKLVNGVLEDGCTHGLYLPGEQVTISASSIDDAGDHFSHWQNQNGEMVSDNTSYTFSVANRHEIYTAVYSEYSVGLAFLSNNDGTCSVSGIGTCSDTVIDIPPVSPSGDVVTAIGQRAFANSQTVTALTIPESVTMLDSMAFSNCRAITSIEIPSNVITINDMCFRGCMALENVTLNNGLQKIGQGVFAQCAITSIIIPETVQILGGDTDIENGDMWSYSYYGVFYNCSKLETVVFNCSIDAISHSIFARCTALKSIEIPNSVTIIGDCAFMNCRALETITLPKSIKVIGDGTFEYCSGLSAINLEDSLTTIGNSAFERCIELGQIEIPSNVMSVGDRAFAYCSALDTITFSVRDTKLDIGIEAFRSCNSLKKISLPNTISIIGSGMFADCSVLNSIGIPDSVIEIGNYAFQNCIALTYIAIPQNVSIIGDGVFMGCSALKNVSVHGDVTSIGNSAFQNCTVLEDLDISDKLETVGAHAFDCCNALKEISLPNTVTVIGEYAFSSCTSLTYFDIPDKIDIINNGLFNGCGMLEGVSMPEGVTHIGEYAFHYCGALKTIELPDSVVSIGYASFYASGLQNAKLGSGLTIIGGSAFAECHSLQNVVFPEGLETICHRAFYRCYSFTSVIIPNSVTQIEWQAFLSCTNVKKVRVGDGLQQINQDVFGLMEQLENVLIGSSVTYIGPKAFWDDKNISMIFYSKTIEDWKNISIHPEGTENIRYSTPLYYSATTPITPGEYWYYDGDGNVRIWNLSKTALMAEGYAETYIEIINASNASFSESLLKVLENDYNFQSRLNNWEALHILANGSITDPFAGKISKKDIYKLAIYELLCGEASEKEGILYALRNTSYMYVSDLVKKAGSHFSKEYLENISTEEMDSSDFPWVDPMFDVIWSTSKNAYEAIEKYGTYIALSNMNSAFYDILNKMSNNFSDGDLRRAAQECMGLYQLSPDDLHKIVMSDFKMEEGKDLIDAFVDVIWDYTAKSIFGANIFEITQWTLKGFLFLDNFINNTDNICNSYYTLYVNVRLQRALTQILQSPKGNYLRLANLANAETYVCVMERYQTCVLFGFDCSADMLTQLSKKEDGEEKDGYNELIEKVKMYKQNTAEYYENYNDLIFSKMKGLTNSEFV